MIGDDLEELTEFMFAHKDSKHRKRSEETNLGRLPIEVVVKILSYVTPQCKRCFRQSELFELRSVCKKMRQLTKLVLLNYGVLDICWIWGGYRVDIDQINYIIVRPLSIVYPCLVYTLEMSKVYQQISYVYL